jgi:hypothetical protein
MVASDLLHHCQLLVRKRLSHSAILDPARINPSSLLHFPFGASSLLRCCEGHGPTSICSPPCSAADMRDLLSAVGTADGVNERQSLPASFPPPEWILHDAAKSLVLAAIGQKIGLQMVLDAEGYRPPRGQEMIQRRRRLKGFPRIIAMTASSGDCGPGKAKRQPETPEEHARKEQILTKPGKGILTELRERKETNHVAAE